MIRGVVWLRSASFAASVALAGCAGAPRAPVASEPEPAPAEPSILSPLDAQVRSVEPWDFQGRQGQTIRTDRYRIFTTDSDASLVRRLPVFLEHAMESYTTALGPLPPPPIKLDTFVMGTRPQWARLTQQLMGDQADLFLRIQRGGYATGGRAVLYNVGAHDTLAIAAHEGWHQYTQRTFRQPLPVWLEEGIGCYMEGFRWDPADPDRPIFMGWANVERFDQLRDAAARGELMPLDQLLESAPQQLLGHSTAGTLNYYAQVWALTHMLHEGADGRYRESLSRLLADAAEGRVVSEAQERLGSVQGRGAAIRRRGPGIFMAYFNADLDEAAREYDDFVSRVTRPGGKDRIVVGRSPIDD